MPGLADMLHKQATALIAIESLGQTTSHLGRVWGTGFPLEACRRADNGTKWAYEQVLELPGAGAAEAQLFFQEGFPGGRLTLQPHQQSQARLSRWARRLGLPLAEARSTPASVGSRVGILPEVLADLSSPLRDRSKERAPRIEHHRPARKGPEVDSRHMGGAIWGVP